MKKIINLYRQKSQVERDKEGLKKKKKKLSIKHTQTCCNEHDELLFNLSQIIVKNQ